MGQVEREAGAVSPLQKQCPGKFMEKPLPQFHQDQGTYSGGFSHSGDK